MQVNVLWLDTVTYLHHHGYDKKVPWYRGTVNNTHPFVCCTTQYVGSFFLCSCCTKVDLQCRYYNVSTDQSNFDCYVEAGMELHARGLVHNWQRFWLDQQHPSWHWDPCGPSLVSPDSSLQLDWSGKIVSPWGTLGHLSWGKELLERIWCPVKFCGYAFVSHIYTHFCEKPFLVWCPYLNLTNYSVCFTHVCADWGYQACIGRILPGSKEVWTYSNPSRWAVAQEPERRSFCLRHRQCCLLPNRPKLLIQSGYYQTDPNFWIKVEIIVTAQSRLGLHWQTKSKLSRRVPRAQGRALWMTLIWPRSFRQKAKCYALWKVMIRSSSYRNL